MTRGRWLEDAKRLPVAAVAERLGLTPRRGRSLTPCPACSADRRGRADGRGPIGIRGDEAGWRCHACGAGGDGPALVALALGVEAGDPRVRDWYGLGLDAAAPRRSWPSMPAPAPAPKRAPVPPASPMTGPGSLAWVDMASVDRPTLRRSHGPWAVLAEALTTIRILPATASKRSHAPAWAPIVARPDADRRRDDAVEALSCLVLDLDELPPGSVAAVVAELWAWGHAAAWHTSWSHTSEAPRMRVVWPLLEPCPRERWREVHAAAVAWAAARGWTADGQCGDLSRCYLLPAVAGTRPDAPEAGLVGGMALDWRRLLAGTVARLPAGGLAAAWAAGAEAGPFGYPPPVPVDEGPLDLLILPVPEHDPPGLDPLEWPWMARTVDAEGRPVGLRYARSYRAGSLAKRDWGQGAGWAGPWTPGRTPDEVGAWCEGTVLACDLTRAVLRGVAPPWPDALIVPGLWNWARVVADDVLPMRLVLGVVPGGWPDNAAGRLLARRLRELGVERVVLRPALHPDDGARLCRLVASTLAWAGVPYIVED